MSIQFLPLVLVPIFAILSFLVFRATARIPPGVRISVAALFALSSISAGQLSGFLPTISLQNFRKTTALVLGYWITPLNELPYNGDTTCYWTTISEADYRSEISRGVQKREDQDGCMWGAPTDLTAGFGYRGCSLLSWMSRSPYHQLSGSCQGMRGEAVFANNERQAIYVRYSFK